MTQKFHHEQIQRGRDAMQKLSASKIAICGAGALGSNLAVNLARMGIAKLTVIDRDRVEEHNIGTQVYGVDDIGGLKSEVLRNLVYREVGDEIVAITHELREQNAIKLLRGHAVVVDAFDNSVSRLAVFDACKSTDLPCVHTGLSGEYGQVQWNEHYIVPSDANDDVCDYPLARNLIMLVVAMTSEAIIRYLLNGEKNNLSVTLADMCINMEQ